MNETAFLKNIRRQIPITGEFSLDAPGMETSLKNALALDQVRLFYFGGRANKTSFPFTPGFEKIAKPDLIRKLQKNPRPTRAFSGKGAGRASLFCPVVVGGNMVACLVLGPGRKAGPFTPGEMGIIDFVIERVALRIQQENLWEELERANRRALAGWMSCAMIHEIRNPLAAIDTLIQLFPRKRKDEIFLQSFEHLMKKEIKRLVKLTEGLLSFSQGTQGGEEQVDISILLEHLGRLLSPLFNGKKVELSVKVPRGFLVRGNENQLECLFLNLIQNAFKAITAHGKIEVTGKELEHSPYGKNWLKIEVRDNGKGVPVNLENKIFDPYFSTDPDGTGLGLVICNQVVKNHGGYISVKNRSRKGALFTVFFPKFIT